MRVLKHTIYFGFFHECLNLEFSSHINFNYLNNSQFSCFFINKFNDLNNSQLSCFFINKVVGES
jgi:hypothetical protein